MENISLARALKRCRTMRAVIPSTRIASGQSVWDASRRAFRARVASGFSCSQAESTPAWLLSLSKHTCHYRKPLVRHHRLPINNITIGEIF